MYKMTVNGMRIPSYFVFDMATYFKVIQRKALYIALGLLRNGLALALWLTCLWTQKLQDKLRICSIPLLFNGYV